MLKKLTKSGEYVHFLIIGIILLFYLFSSPVIFKSNQSNLYTAPFGIWIQDFISLNPSLGKVINVILITLTSLFVNKIGKKTEILPRQSFITSSILSLFLLFSPETTQFTGCLVIMLLLTFSFSNMVGIFGKQYPYQQILTATIAISVSSLIIPQTIIFIIFIWLGFLTYSVNSFREWIISFIGIAIPYIYMLFAWYWYDNLDYFFDLYGNFFKTFRIDFNTPTTYQIITLAILASIYLSSMFYFINTASEKIINVRKRMWLTFQFSFISIATLAIGGNSSFLVLPLVYISMSIMFSYSVHYQKQSRIQDILILFLIISIFINRVVV